MGGPDAEHEVSLMSGREVAQALRDTGRYEVTELVLERRWATADEIAAAYDEVRSAATDETATCTGKRVSAVVFPVLHGPWGEGGPLQDILETLGHPYVGSDPRAAAVAMDKPATKQIVGAQGVLTPPGCLLE